jgi:transcriptional regulator GlxA family with amidase domain
VGVESALFRGRHFRDEIIVLCLRLYLRYPPSCRNLEEMMAERGLQLVCLSEMHMSPGRFVDRLPVEAARQVIDSSSIGLKEVADACGFKTADAMRRAFLRVIGVSPSAYSSRFKRAS